MKKVFGAVNLGYESTLVSVECHISNGLPGVSIVGLANKSVDEAKDRIRAAFSASGLEFPKKKILINLAPADIPKNDSGLDMAIAATLLLKSSGQSAKDAVYIGELSLDGSLKASSGVIGKALSAQKTGVTTIYVAEGSAQQVAMVPGVSVHPVSNLTELAQILSGQTPRIATYSTQTEPKNNSSNLLIDEVVGQDHVKRALLIAAAGGHNIHMYGPPGTGKTMLSRAMAEILPDLLSHESLEVTHLHSLNGHQETDPITTPPFRAPHHSASDVSIIGGGNSARPGEISMAHKGLLMLDELPEYSKKALEALRQPLEDKTIVVSRAKLTTTYPADFILVATSNPCPCGYHGSDKPCSCTAHEIVRYQKKLSGPIMDRIDMHIQVTSVEHADLLKQTGTTTPSTLKEDVKKVREVQISRGGLSGGLKTSELKKLSKLSDDAKEFLDKAAKGLGLSSRGYIKVVRLSRTIADIESSQTIEKEHVSEALQYRQRSNEFI